MIRSFILCFIGSMYIYCCVDDYIYRVVGQTFVCLFCLFSYGMSELYIKSMNDRIDYLQRFDSIDNQLKAISNDSIQRYSSSKKTFGELKEKLYSIRSSLCGIDDVLFDMYDDNTASLLNIETLIRQMFEKTNDANMFVDEFGNIRKQYEVVEEKVQSRFNIDLPEELDDFVIEDSNVITRILDKVRNFKPFDFSYFEGSEIVTNEMMDRRNIAWKTYIESLMTDEEEKLVKNQVNALIKDLNINEAQKVLDDKNFPFILYRNIFELQSMDYNPKYMKVFSTNFIVTGVENIGIDIKPTK